MKNSPFHIKKNNQKFDLKSKMFPISTVRGRERVQRAERLRSRSAVHQLPGRTSLRMSRRIHGRRLRDGMSRRGRMFAWSLRQGRCMSQHRGRFPMFLSAGIRRRPVSLVQRYATNARGSPLRITL